jgi:hypothetical protein
MPWAIWLVIELDRDIMANNILMKFGDDPMKTVRLRERTSLKKPIFDNSRAIILTCLEQYGWLSNLIEILWPLTF